jgi:hypothetical protein
MQFIQQILGLMVDALRGVLGYFGLSMPSWGLPALGLLLVVAMGPRLLQNVHLSQARSALGRSRVAEGEARRALEDRAFERVHADRNGLEIVAIEAVGLGRRALGERCLARMTELGAATASLSRVRRALQPPEKLPANALAAAVLVDGLLERGLADEARARLAAAQVRWPQDLTLAAVAARLAAAAPDPARTEAAAEAQS